MIRLDLRLLAAPVLLAAAFYHLLPSLGGNSEARMIAEQAERAALAADVAKLEFEEIIRALAAAPPAPASAREQASTRIGQGLPGDLEAFYRAGDGIPRLILGPVTSLRVLGPHDPAQITPLTDPAAANHEPLSMPANAFSDALLLGSAHGQQVLRLTRPLGGLPAGAILRGASDFYRAVSDLQALLADALVTERQQAAHTARLERLVDAEQRRLSAASTDELLRALDPSADSFALRFLAPTRPAAAPEHQLRKLEARIGETLMPFHRELLSRANGGHGINLLPVPQIIPTSVERIGAWLADSGRVALTVLDHEGRERTLGPAAFASCWDIGGFGPEQPFPANLLWCPDRPEALVDTLEGRSYPGLRAWVLRRAARYRAILATDGDLMP